MARMDWEISSCHDFYINDAERSVQMMIEYLAKLIVLEVSIQTNINFRSYSYLANLSPFFLKSKATRCTFSILCFETKKLLNSLE
jgi:hypothetical protein